MPVSLYDVLGVPATATPEEIRKAYRRRALQTHPDRLGPNPTPEQKQQAEDRFRKVNAAYEVLNDPENRNLYDRHGVWPPPNPTAAEEPSQRPRHQSFGGTSAQRSRSRRQTQPEHNTFPDPFAGLWDRPGGGGYHRDFPFAFTDPHELFSRIFGDAHAAFANDPFFSRDPFFVQPGSMFVEDPFTRADRIFQNSFNEAFAVQGGTDVVFARAQARSYASGGGRTTSESFQKTMVNGRIETLHERRDDRGNHFVTRTTPDGKTRHWVNGKEQPELEAPHAKAPPIRAPTPPAPPPPYSSAPPPPVPPVPPLPAPSSRRQRQPSRPTPVPPPPPPPPPSHHRAPPVVPPPQPIPPPTRHRSPPLVPPPPAPVPPPGRHRSHSVAPPPPPPPPISRHRSSLPVPQAPPQASYQYYPDYARHPRPPYPAGVPDPRTAPPPPAPVPPPRYADERQDKKPFWSRPWRR
ncbi:DnaJ-domain-containing protein [Auricularia subglabra TFB-10046 SS5]|nr:DnaJ-domain-containing protein [Auricularia subglabra TFB-10046 SS5]